MNDFSGRPSQPHAARTSLLAEYWSFLRYTGKWWIVPILIVTLALGLLVFLGGTGAAPFIYTLF